MKTLRLTVLLALALALLPANPTLALDRDPLASITDDMSTSPLETYPDDMLSENDFKAIEGRVVENRNSGVAFAVRIVELSADNSPLGTSAGLDPQKPISPETAKDLANRWMSTRPIESTSGARDGYLLLIIVPDNPAHASAAFVWGERAQPQNGITPDNMQAILDETVFPQLAEGNIAMAAWNGAGDLSYDNQFGRPDRLELDELHEDLQMVAGIPLAAITAFCGLGILTLIAWIRGRTRPEPVDPTGMNSPYQAGAVALGRASDPVVTAAFLTLSRTGALTATPHSDEFIVHRDTPVSDPFAARVRDILARQTDENGVVTRAAARRMHDVMLPARHELENTLAQRGFFNREAKSEAIWVILAISLTAAIVLFTLPPAVLGMARFAIFAIVFAALCAVVGVAWILRRSWATARGKEALASWLETAPADERAIYDTIVRQDALITTVGGPTVPDTTRFIRAVRGMGAA